MRINTRRQRSDCGAFDQRLQPDIRERSMSAWSSIASAA
jgi:hypothetical protein